jgi:hypothetical protein
VALAGTNALVSLSTGGDDLRGGNRAFITLNLIGTPSSTSEVLLSRGLAGNSRIVSQVTFPETFSRDQVRGIRIRHDGSPRSRHPFDTYDNWNLNAVVVQLADPSFSPVGEKLYDSTSDSLTSIATGEDLLLRFTGAARTLDLPVRAIGSEPDFTISSITRGVFGRTLVQVKNLGERGTVLSVGCAVAGALSFTTEGRLLNRNGSTIYQVALNPVAFAAVTSVRGVPEFNTSNNRRRVTLF